MFLKRSVRSDWRITGGVSSSGLELPAAAAATERGELGGGMVIFCDGGGEATVLLSSVSVDR